MCGPQWEAQYSSHAHECYVPCHVVWDGTQCLPLIDTTHVLWQTYKLSGVSSVLGVATTAHELGTAFPVETGPGLVLSLKVQVSRSAQDSVQSICKKVPTTLHACNIHITACPIGPSMFHKPWQVCLLPDHVHVVNVRWTHNVPFTMLSYL